MTTVFGKIIQGLLPSKKVFENERILAIEDIAPVAPIHILIMPKKEIPNLQSVESQDMPLVLEILEVARKLAVEYNIEDGYRLVTNNGAEGGQVVLHLHFHLIGGRQLHGSLG
jgi:histidine triad (HIT) family protein